MTRRFPRFIRRAVSPLLLALAFSAHADALKASRFYEDGLSRFSKQDLPGAIIQLKNALQQDKNMLAAHLLLAKVYLASGDVGPAEVAFREALRLGVSRAEVAVPLGRIYLMQGRSQILLDSIPADGLPAGTRLEVLVLRGKAYAALGKQAEAISSFAEARAIDPASAVPLIAEVPVLLAAGKGAAAMDSANKALELAPESAEVLNARASVAHAAGNLADALKYYERAIALQPAFVDARVARDGILIDLGRDTDAGEDLEDLARIAPSEPRVAYLRALLASRRGDAQTAAQHLEDVARLVDALPAEWVAGQEQLLMTGALAHHAGRQYEKARKYLDVLIARYPRNQGARKLLAAVYVDTADYARAISLLENVLRAQPDDAQALHLLGRAYLGQKRYSKATGLLEKAVALGMDDPGLRASLGFSQLGQDNTAAATANLQAAFDKTPGDFTLALSLANLHMRNGDAKKALDVAQSVNKALPGNPAVLNLLGVVKGSSADLAGAREAYGEALKRDPRFTPARLNLGRVSVAERRFEDARAIYAAMLKENRRDATVMYESALLESAAGNAVEALRWLEKGFAERPDDVRIGLELIALRGRGGDRAGALEAARALSSRSTGNLDVLAALARAEIDAGDSKSALQTLRDMTKFAEFDTRALVRIGYLQLAAGSPEAAAYSAQKALQGTSNDLLALVLSGEAALQAQDLTRVEEVGQEVRRRYPADAAGYRLTGDAAMARKAFSVAADAYQKGHERQPSTELVLRQVKALVAEKKLASSATLLRDWIKSHEGDFSAKKALAELRMMQGDWASARREYEQLLAKGAADAGVLNNLANVLIEMNDRTAVATARQALALSPQSALVLDTLGWALVKAGELDEAVAVLREARLREPGNTDVRFHLASALKQKGRRDEARDVLKGLASGDGGALASDRLQLIRELGL